MRHKRYRTTLGYINHAEQIGMAVANLKVPGVLQMRQATTSTDAEEPRSDQRAESANPASD